MDTFKKFAGVGLIIFGIYFLIESFRYPLANTPEAKATGYMPYIIMTVAIIAGGISLLKNKSSDDSNQESANLIGPKKPTTKTKKRKQNNS